MKATARAGGVLTIERRQEGTTDGNWGRRERRSMQPSRPAISWRSRRASRLWSPGRLAAPLVDENRRNAGRRRRQQL
ncbi:hypothetical protein ACPA9J_10365 [Pseudomonas aeruginosa]